ncbi:cation-translocating P-type ATPase [Actinomycetospora chibensis]|uniref:Cation-translocating P-type ATPase n=1 Tax=Actinomycetospora chibensis TaxID=663606 RepID=A0ABV9RG70_9PSEU|nr:cation-transporting P-type ATPase [Actinomycetospora chibensis]MDD7922188.1 cation-transporting P-type ATPase [Actinomycetospora chibensis]
MTPTRTRRHRRHPPVGEDEPGPAPPAAGVDAPLERLWHELRSGPEGLDERDAARRLQVQGPNALPVRGGPSWPRALAHQLVHPLALLLWAAAGLALVAGTPVLAAAVVIVIALNAALAFWQEQHAERAVAALEAYLPAGARVLRGGVAREVPASEIVTGDVVLLAEGAAVPADGRLVAGTVELDMSALTGESIPAPRRAGPHPPGPVLEAPDLVFRGTTCTSGSARAVVTGTGAHTEIGRIAALTGHVGHHESPLEQQVRRVAWLITAVAVGVGAAFLPIGLAAGLSFSAALVFAIGLLVANVPEGLLPTITLALAAGVRSLARHGAVVRRLSAVETLGSTTVICTDKTGTLTENRMSPQAFWAPATGRGDPTRDAGAAPALARVAQRCSDADLPDPARGRGSGDPTELALLALAAAAGLDTRAEARSRRRVALHAFDPVLRLMSTVDETPDGPAVHTKGAVEAVLARCTRLRRAAGAVPLGADERDEVLAVAEGLAAEGLRVLALATRPATAADARAPRADVEAGLVLEGLVGLFDRPRDSVAPAITRCHAAGISVHVVTGDHPATAGAVARAVGIGADGLRVVTGVELAALRDDDLDALLGAGDEIVFARVAPEDKLRIVEALEHLGEVVAVTGDGVNDAPALRRADIGIAMGASGTDVAREAATMVLTDDDFATIERAVAAGRRVYDDVRKFVVYIFAHAVPEVVPFLLFALSGGSIPLGLTVLQILAIDLGTETLPALALGREPAEPGLMDRPPRPRSEGLVRPRMLWRAWGLLGITSAVLTTGAFLLVLLRAGWTPGAPTGPGSALHPAYLEATTATFVGIVACQIGTAFAARTEHASLRSVGLGTNPLLWWGIAFEVLVTAAVVYLPVGQQVVGTAPLDAPTVALLLCCAPLVWGVDELDRWRRRRSPTTPDRRTT